MKIATPSPGKMSPPLSQQPPSKSWGLVKPHFWKSGWSLNPSAERGRGGMGGGGGAHYAVVPTLTLRGGWEEFYPHPQHSTPP